MNQNNLKDSHAAQRLLQHVLSVQWDLLPEQAQEAAKNFLHDTLCVGIAGRFAPDTERIWKAVQGWTGSSDKCIVLGRPGVTANAPYAAYINAYQIHSQEFDCVHEPAVAHPMATIVATLLADAQRCEPKHAKDFLSALVAGVDVVATLGVVVTTPLRFFRPATAGIFGSVAALCRMRKVSIDVAMNAFGHALAYASGTMQAHLEGKPTLALQVAGAARSAIEAMDLAMAGIQAPYMSIDGPFGYLSLFEGGYELEPSLQALGKQWRISELSWKPFPTGRAAHGAIVATQNMMQNNGLTAASLVELCYEAPPLIARLVGRRPFRGMGPAHARLCFAYLGAVTLLRGKVTLFDFSEDRLSDEETLKLAEKIMVNANGNPDPAAFVPAILKATTQQGFFEEKVSKQFGSPEWPLTKEQHIQKSKECLDFAQQEEIHGNILKMIDAIENFDDVGSLISESMIP